MNENKYEFPFEKLPQLGALPLPIFQKAVDEVVKAHKVPLKLATYCAVAAAGALGQMIVDVRKPAGGVVPASVYVLLQGKSGERKTTVDECFFRELRKPNKAQRKRYLDEVNAYKIREKIWNRKSKVLMNALGDVFADGDDTTAIERLIAENEKDRPEEPKETKLIFNDVTIAALKDKLDQSPNATLLSSDAKKIMTSLLLQNDADFNQIWSGETNDVARKTTRSYTLDSIRFSFSLMIQPGALNQVMAKAGQDAKNSGFFARVIFCDVGTTQGDRLIEIIDVPSPDLVDFNQRCAELLVQYIEALEAGDYKRRVLNFSPEASRVWIAYFNYVESNIKAGGRYENASDHASKLADNVARVAAVLHVLEGFGGEISVECMLSATVLCDEASRDYMEYIAPKDEDEIEAVKLKNWLVEKYVLKRQVWIDQNRLLQFAPNRMRSAAKMHRYLEILERGEYLVVWPPGSGGRAKAQIELRMTYSGEPKASWRTLYDSHAS